MNKQTLRQLTDPSQNKTNSKSITNAILIDVLWDIFNEENEDTMETYFEAFKLMLKVYGVKPKGDIGIFMDRINNRAITKAKFTEEFNELLECGYEYLSPDEQEESDISDWNLERGKFEDSL